jgi:hypothetical protein
LLHNGGLPRIETGPDGSRKAEWNLQAWPYGITFELGHKPRVRVGESPWLVTPDLVRRYYRDGQSWLGVGYNPLQVASSNRVSRISTSHAGTTVQTEIRQIAAGKIQDWELNYEFGAEISFSGKFPAAEGRSVYYTKFTTNHHLDREAFIISVFLAVVAPGWQPRPVGKMVMQGAQ